MLTARILPNLMFVPAKPDSLEMGKLAPVSQGFKFKCSFLRAFNEIKNYISFPGLILASPRRLVGYKLNSMAILDKDIAYRVLPVFIIVVFYFVIDIDECTASVPVCDVNANCQNTPGSHVCSCKAGFTGDGKTCAGEKIAK